MQRHFVESRTSLGGAHRALFGALLPLSFLVTLFAGGCKCESELSDFEVDEWIGADAYEAALDSEDDACVFACEATVTGVEVNVEECTLTEGDGGAQLVCSGTWIPYCE